jgi:hypothetical protein
MQRAAEARPAPGDPVRYLSWDAGFGLALTIFALLALFVWFPNDITGGFIERNQVGRIGPGDAFFPVLLASAILLLALIDVTVSLFRARSGAPPSDSAGGLTLGNIVFLVRFHSAVLLGLIAMYWLGPLVVAAQSVMTGNDLSYRQLVDTPPYKYIGFILGALIATLPTIAWAERRWSRRSALTVLLVVIATIFIFDVLLTNVQLPPNADY